MAKILQLSDPLNLPEITPEVEDALSDAQDLAFEAWEKSRPGQKIALAKKALEISPYCVDAYNILAEEAETDEEALRLYKRGEEVGRAYFGKEFFKENMGIFWGILETRPYMRAKHGIARSYAALGDRKNAIKHYLEMLELCENDNMGVRDIVFPLLIEEGGLEKAEALSDKYENDSDAFWLYGRVLLEYAKNGEEGALKYLPKALEANKEAAKYLAQKKKMPARLPWAYSLGSKEEAIHVAHCQLDAWKATGNASEWLAAKLPKRGRWVKKEEANNAKDR